MTPTLIAAILTAGIAGHVLATEPPKAAPAGQSAITLATGIDWQYVDPSVRPQDDFYRAVNGKWLATVTIPADKARYGAFDKLRDDTEDQVKAIIERVASMADAAPGTETQKIRDLYNSFMDVARIEELGLAPLTAAFARIDALQDKEDVAALIAYFNSIGIGTPYTPRIHQDNRDSTKYVVDLKQSGLGMPDRDYYLDDKFSDTRAKYGVHVEKMLSMAGDKNAAQSAKDIVAVETELAKAQWTRVESRDAVKTYNKVALTQLEGLAPGIDWKRWLVAAGIEGKVDYLIVSQPTYITTCSQLVEKTALPVWKSYFRWRLLHDGAPYLAKAFVDESFAFYGTVVRGIPDNRPRWKRGTSFVEEAIGEALGKLYVDQHFPPANKARMEALVGYLIQAYRESIDTLDWMGRETKREAHAKLAKLTTKIGYPKVWRDYSGLVVKPDDLIGNVLRAEAFEYQRNIAKLGKPIDRDEWGMTPQTVNAYYNRERNEIVFPAALLQPPFFNAAADDAVNYGGIGAVIGHEISHGFDDQGSRYNGDGNLHEWFTADDLKNFKAKTQALVAQYDQYEPVAGFHVNGALTLGENVADNSGLVIAYKAYHLSLAGGKPPVLDNLTGDQRLYYGWAQVWRGKAREAETIRLLQIDTHSPQAVRGIAPPRNQPGFYEAFGIKPGDKMYLPPEQRVTIW